MELKQPHFRPWRVWPILLIVPYGIETLKALHPDLPLGLLIVPYGIETHLNSAFILRSLLLIVPYGIETVQARRWYQSALAFNRTLWNWNTFQKNGLMAKLSFNRTLWNWNNLTEYLIRDLSNLLIVPYGIETLYYVDCCRLFRYF